MSNGNQKYLGNGKHEWESVVAGRKEDDYNGEVSRLRVPGGWLYSVCNYGDSPDTLVFVPLPTVVRHAL